MDRNLLELYLVTDRRYVCERSLEDIVMEAVQGGVTIVQLREKDLPTKDFIEEAISLKRALKPYGVPIIINDRVDVALASEADGVHIGQSDMPYHLARKLLGPDKIIGLSVENMEQVTQANALDVDYIGVSPVFRTPTKTDTSEPFGMEGLRNAVQISRHPIVAIGGINLTNASSITAAGADGVAVVSAIMGAESPCKASSEMLKAMETNKK